MCAGATAAPPLQKHGVVHARPVQAGPQTPRCPPGGCPGGPWHFLEAQQIPGGGGLETLLESWLAGAQSCDFNCDF